MTAAPHLSGAQAKALVAALSFHGVVPVGSVGWLYAARVGSRTIDALHRRRLLSFDGEAGVYRTTDLGRAALDARAALARAEGR